MATKALGHLPIDVEAGAAPDHVHSSSAKTSVAKHQAASRGDVEVDALLATVEDLVRQATSTTAAADALTKIRALAGNAPAQFGVRRALLVLREKVGDTDGLVQEIEALFQAHPDDRALLEMYLRGLVKSQAKDKALAMLESIYPAASADADVLTERAELLDRSRLHAESDAAYAAALALEDRPSIRIEWAKRLTKRFHFDDAGRLLDGLSKPLSGEKARAIKADIDAERAFFGRFFPEEDLVGKDFRLLAMKLAVLHYRNRTLRIPPQNALKLSLLTGHLGAGGAERQLCALARLMQSDIADGSEAHDVGFSHVEVIVKEHARPGVSDFFLSDLQAAGIPVHQINEMKPVKAAQQAELDSDLAHLMAMLPAQVHYGVARLAPHFRTMQPDVVSLWQDGACLFGALAALFAGVPSIQLVFRGLPPNIRINRYKPEYELLYSALALVPGVEFVCNSQSGAEAYADWLGLPVERIKVLYNGVQVANLEPAEKDRQSWKIFDAATPDASETIGGVFRFESDKRPLTWIRIAAAYARERPMARFVIVGDGRLLPNARELAQKLGIADRLLFAGRSHAVGFWYDRIDVKLLTSRFEGLPNVLIEAQLCGRPVVSTPAGGASECFAPGSTGHLLDCADSPDLDAACEAIRDLVDRRRRDPRRMMVETLEFSKRFGVDAFLGVFREICGLPLRQTVEA